MLLDLLLCMVFSWLLVKLALVVSFEPKQGVSTGWFPLTQMSLEAGHVNCLLDTNLGNSKLTSTDNIGLIASKTCATAVRGQYYGFAAAIGKVGAFVGGLWSRLQDSEC